MTIGSLWSQEELATAKTTARAVPGVHAGRHLKRRKELGPSVFSLNDRKSKCPIPTGWKIQIVDDDGDPTDPNEYLVERGEVGLQNFLWR